MIYPCNSKRLIEESWPKRHDRLSRKMLLWAIERRRLELLEMAMESEDWDYFTHLSAQIDHASTKRKRQEWLEKTVSRFVTSGS